MGLLDTLRSLLGLDSDDEPDRSADETDVTVEYEAEPTEVEADVPEPTGEDTSTTAPPADATDEDDGVVEADDDEGVEADEDDDEVEADDDKDTGDEADGASGAGAEPVQSITGIGPAYGDRLAAAGVETVADLASEDATALAERVDIGEGRLETWIDRAGAKIE